MHAAHSKSLTWPQYVGVASIIAAAVAIGYAARLVRAGRGDPEPGAADPQ